MTTGMRVAGDKEGKGSKAMAAAMSRQTDGNGNEVGRQATTMAMKMAMAMAMRVAGNKEGYGNGNEVGGQVVAMGQWQWQWQQGWQVTKRARACTESSTLIVP
jgi:hypothetical protein